MTRHSSSTARIFRQPTAQQRAVGKRLRIEPPISQIPAWWQAVAWWIWFVTAVALALVATVAFMVVA